MLGLQKGEVKLVPHNPEWIKQFNQEKELLESLIGDYILGIEHIGSTAIEEIHAKPIIDIMIGLKPLNNARDISLRTMQKAGYYRLRKQTVENKVIFAKFTALDSNRPLKTHYLHMVEYEGDWWKEHIAFRDRLNAEPNLAKEYESLKLDLASQYQDDVMAYAEQKLRFIKCVIQ
ncbi:GrpB family protein [Piscibacillus halophilus]|uniref:GrpB domain, predicted nucleotidyltransferase, UPF0157 family n=1 Tax=Piscibacillus halophilus TaxID=571933 RepID=A0A1H9CEA4_9BACI|nr:GrpB family protein [Piscibacillus halophilus]SEP99516.1 GrpB domain, predicted nucleotidyltransferase, UPF0157 family [Piscibacillus halophilus]